MDMVADALACRRAGRLIFRDLAFSIGSGEAVLLRGPNGSGKSTLLRVIAGLLSPETGDIRIDDVSLRADPGAFQEHLAYAGHLDAVKLHFTVLENLRFWARLHGQPTDFPPSEAAEGPASEDEDDAPAAPARRGSMLDDDEDDDEPLAPPADRLEAALDRLGLRKLANVPAGYCSAGQKRRLGLARLLILDRPVWLLDEPTVSLDANAVDIFGAMVREHLEGGGLAIAATHVPLGLDSPREIVMGAPAVAPDSDSDDDPEPREPDDPFLEGDWS